jgi:hypothetical protein
MIQTMTPADIAATRSMLAGLREATAQALDELIQMTVLTAWGDVSPADVDRVGEVYDELAAGYFSALSTVLGADEYARRYGTAA